jgi:hypothetical protein
LYFLMQSFGACPILSGERAGNPLLAHFEQFLALKFCPFQPALHDCSTLLALFLGEIQFAQHATHAAVAFPALTGPASFTIRHAFTPSFHPLDALSLESSILSRGCLSLRFLSENAHANGQHDSGYT